MRLPGETFAPYQSPSYVPPIQDAPAQTPAPVAPPSAPYQSPPYVPPIQGAPVRQPVRAYDTGLELKPGQVYRPEQSGVSIDTGQTFRGSRGGYAPSYAPTPQANGRYPGRAFAVSYIGPTASARPAFNVNFRRLRVRDVFNR